MTNITPERLEAILHSIAHTAPEPLYPRDYAERTGMPRESLDEVLERMRLAGLLRLTEWVANRGQGYALTPAGKQALSRPGEVARLCDRAGSAPPPAVLRQRVRHEPDRSTFDRGEEIRDSFLSPHPPVITFLLIALNVLVFVAGLHLASQRGVSQGTYLNGGNESDPAEHKQYNDLLYELGAAEHTDALQGHWWHLLTACFVHVGAFHLGLNMFALYFLGPLMERAYGRWRYLVLYLVSGFVGSCLGILLQGALAGASGAICGLLGGLASWTVLNRSYLPPTLYQSWMRYVVTNTIIIALITFMPGMTISWSGHLGGGVGGLLAGVLLNYQRWGRRWQQILAIPGIVALPLAAYAILEAAPAYSASWAAMQEAEDKNKAAMQEAKDKSELVRSLRPQTDPISDKAAGDCRQAFLHIRDAFPKAPAEDVASEIGKSLEEDREACSGAAEQFAKAGPMHGEAEKVRKKRQVYFTELTKYCTMLRDCLQAGRPSSAEEMKALDRQNTNTKRLERWSP